jgi:hypothetical protein
MAGSMLERRLVVRSSSCSTEGGKAAVSEGRATESEGGASQRSRTVYPSCEATHALVQK